MSDPPSIAAIVLAAGRSTRMGAGNKLVADIAGTPMVRHAVEAALGSRARPVIVVVGHQADAVRAALAGLDIVIVENPDFATGLASSLKAGIRALASDCAGALILLGDMPLIAPAHLDRLVAAFAPGAIVVPTHRGKRGNPVLWSRRFFNDLMALEGDVGARHLIGGYAEAVAEVPVEDAAVLIDVDTPEALLAARTAMFSSI